MKSDTQELNTRPSAAWPSVLLVLLGLFGSVFVLKHYTEIAAPSPYFEPPRPSNEPVPESLTAALGPDAVEPVYHRILEQGSRLVGQPAALETADRIEAAFREAGMEVIRHESQTVVPVTKRRELYVQKDGAYEKADHLPIHTLMPNHMQPTTTGQEGLRGKLLLLNRETIDSRENFEGAIGVINAKAGEYDERYGFKWSRYARLGLKGLIVTHSEGLEALPWQKVFERHEGLVSSASVDYLRVLAGPEIMGQIGKQVRLNVKVEWEKVLNPTIVGVMRAEKRAHESIVLAADYDAVGYLPDQAVDPLSAINAAWFMQMAKGLAGQQQRLQRDIIMVASGAAYNASSGRNHILRLARLNYGNDADVEADAAEGEYASASYRKRPVLKRLDEHRSKAKNVREILSRFGNKGFVHDVEETRVLVNQLNAETRAFLSEQAEYVMKRIVLDQNEALKDQSLELLRKGVTYDREHPEYQRYRRMRKAYDQVNAAAGAPFLQMLEKYSETIREYAYRDELKQRFDALSRHHRFAVKRLETELSIASLMDEYQQIMAFHPHFLPSMDESEQERILFTPPEKAVSSSSRERYAILRSISENYKNDSERKDFALEPLTRDTWSLFNNYFGDYIPANRDRWWYTKGYESYSMATSNRPESVRRRAEPFVEPWMRELDSLKHTMQLAARLAFRLGEGKGRLEPQVVREYRIRTFGGRTLASGTGQSTIPNFPLAGALISNRPVEGQSMFSMPGYYYHPFIMSDPYGHYEMFEPSADFAVGWRVAREGGHTPLAATFDEQGRIYRVKDEGEDTQRLFQSNEVSWQAPDSLRNVSMVLFRATPVSIYDLNNPQTMRDYNSVRMITGEGLSDFQKSLQFSERGTELFFIPPEKYYYTLFQAGMPGNENVHEPRAFALNVEGTKEDYLEDIYSPKGYLSMDVDVLDRVPFRVANSMLFVNGQRLDLQNQYHMADDRVNEYHERAKENLEAAQQEGQPYVEAYDKARQSVVYSTLNHPVLLESINEAVYGIVWYLFLLVPFVFFFEKLTFCYSDTRKQVLAQIGIFLVCFTILRVLHPAFEMIRSSLMILLGFVIILIAGGITFLFSSKFKENLEELRKKAGKVSAAEVNKFGVMGTAFMLGLNNMHRRKVRTGLTCGTLVLLTFVMISFSSMQNDIVDDTVALGKAEYQGMLIRKDDFESVSNQEIFALKNKYSEDYSVVQRSLLVGTPIYGEGVNRTPEIKLNPASGQGRKATAHAYLKFDAMEPLRHQLEYLTQTGWFTEEALNARQTPLILSDKQASIMGIRPNEVDKGEVALTIRGRTYRVHSIFTAESLNRIRDLDGNRILPYDFGRVSDFMETGEGILVQENEPRVDAQDVFLLPHSAPKLENDGSDERVLSAAVVMDGAPYREASQTIEDFLVQLGQPIYYGLDEVAYRGLKTRSASFSGMADLIIPLLIAGLTVLNTMKGSVYERSDEIFVYNAVGIAPRYVFFMFIAEAFVYAVVGSVLGYMLSQGVGRILIEFGWTGGLDMTYTSLTTIYASWTIMAAVFLSTYFPARQAMKIAAPSEDAGWSVPEPEGDQLSMDLPFTFRHRGRFAVVAFFHHFLSEHGEGSAGRFFASPPAPRLWNDPERPGEKIPGVECTIWLKPFDLGVSEHLCITLPVDPETGLYKARLTLQRISGTYDNWTRLNKPLIQIMRRQFLHWRAVTEYDRDRMFEECRELMQQNIQTIEPSAKSAELNHLST